MDVIINKSDKKESSMLMLGKYMHHNILNWCWALALYLLLD
jgi:hypothetical protein